MRKILIIKFSAIGDVVERLPVAAALKELYKDGCEITWITKSFICVCWKIMNLLIK